MNAPLAKVADLSVNNCLSTSDAQADDSKESFALVGIEMSPLVLFLVKASSVP